MKHFLTKILLITLTTTFLFSCNAVKRVPEKDYLLEKNKILQKGLGEELIGSFVKLKMQEWDQFTSHLSEWERNNVLDC